MSGQKWGIVVGSNAAMGEQGTKTGSAASTDIIMEVKLPKSDYPKEDKNRKRESYRLAGQE